jgi:mannose-1-phosphate guanylyltransferase / mannose-6-phosphate isomerase
MLICGLEIFSKPYSAPVQLIEVQCGLYLEEDDIVRYSDIYGRV